MENCNDFTIILVSFMVRCYLVCVHHHIDDIIYLYDTYVRGCMYPSSGRSPGYCECVDMNDCDWPSYCIAFDDVRRYTGSL